MPWNSSKRRKLAGRQMAHKRWSQASQAQRQAQARKMVEGKRAKWAREIDPEGTLEPAELEKQLANKQAEEMAQRELARWRKK